MAKHDSDEEDTYEGDGDGLQDYGGMVDRSHASVKRKPSYYNEAVAVEEDWEDEVEPRNEDEEVMEIMKMEQSEDFCRVCGLGGKLLCCDTCPAVYHLGCLDPALKIAPMGKWSCPKCVDPLENLEKIVDCQMRPLKSPGTVEDPAGSSSARLVKQYLVKWKGRSYLHCSWIRQEELEKGMKSFPIIRMKLNHFQRQLEAAKKLSTSDEDRVFVRPEWTTVDRILDTRQNGDIKEYFVKWKDLGYDELTWELEEDIAPFHAEINKHSALLQKGASKALMKRKIAVGLDVKEAKRRRKEFKTYKKTPKFLVGGALHRFQLEGLNFLRFAWEQEKNVILADEMGLGKMVQAVAFLAALAEEGVTFSLPHLVVAPTPTLQNWEREFSTWAPHLNVVTYGGSSDARSYIRDFEFYYPNKLKGLKDRLKKKQLAELRQSKQERIKFDVLLTSHEMAGLDLGVLKSISWECLIIDEGHRMKNKDAKLFSTLESLSTHQHILLTGAPLPSNSEDLVMLMRFLGAGKFSCIEEIHEDFRNLHHEEQITKLQKLLAPHTLRRVKRDVIKELPAKRELILRVELTQLQKEYYKGILSRNYPVLSRPGGPQFALNNVMMELRKLCAHPFMLDGAEPDARSEQEANRQLLEASEKLSLLERMMVKLRVQGHRVLIYSQFARMLDILEEWLLYKKWGYERIDGKINGPERQVRIDRFNAQNSTKFCFLLSTQAGVGMHLATADTVIIYDSDWNSHADLQSMGRAHVMIFRLVTRGTIEERMMQMTKRKTVIEHLMTGRPKSQAFVQEEIDDVLKYGAKELFGDGNDSGRARPIHYDDAAIERLLERSQPDGVDERLDEREAADLARAYKTTNYDLLHEEDAGEDVKRHIAADHQIPRLDASERSHFWYNLLKDKGERQHYPDDLDDHRGKRNRKQYSGQPMEEDDLAGLADVSSEDDDYEYTAHSEHDSGGYAREKFHPPKKRAREEPEEHLEPAPLMEGEGRSLKVLGFTQKQRAIFVQVLMRYGLGDFTWSDFVPRLKQKRREEIKDYGTLFLSHIAEDISDSLTFSDGVPKEGLRIQDVLVRLAVLHLIGDKVRALMENPDAPLLSIGARNHRYYSLRNTKVWKEEHDRKLLQAILKLGYGRWQAIVDEPELGLQSVIRNEILLRENAADGRPPDGDGGISNSAQNADGHLEGGSDKGSDDEIPMDGSGPGGNKETSEAYMQKKMVDFVKRRVLVLEKVLNAEYLKDSSDPGGNEDISPPTNDGRAKASNTGVLDGPDAKGQNSKSKPPHLYPMPLAEDEISAAAVDNDPNRLKVAQIYGQMCELMLENQGDADQAYVGNKSAGLRLRKSLRQLDTLCLEMRKALFGQPLQSRKVRSKPDDAEGHEMDAQSDENDEVGVDSENELENDMDNDNDHDAKLEEKIKPSSSSETGHSSADEPSPVEQGIGRDDSSDNEEKPRKRFQPIPRMNIGGSSVSVKIEQSSVAPEGSGAKRFKGPKQYLKPKPQYSESP